MTTQIITLNKSVYAAMPAEVAEFVRQTAKAAGVRKVLYSTVPAKAGNMWADEGATITAFYGGSQARESMVDEATIGGGANMNIGRYTAPAGAWIVSEKWFMGKRAISVYHVLQAEPEVAAPADFEAEFTPVIEVPAIPAEVPATAAIVLAAEAPVVPAEVPQIVANAVMAAGVPVQFERGEWPFVCVDLDIEDGVTFYGGRPLDCRIPAGYTMVPTVYEVPMNTWVLARNKATGAYTARYAEEPADGWHLEP